jgi:hypothetical protein
MQFIDFDKTAELSGIDSEIERIVREGFKTQKQAALVDRAGILAFFGTGLARRMKEAKRVFREERFNLASRRRWSAPAPHRGLPGKEGSDPGGYRLLLRGGRRGGRDRF